MATPPQHGGKTVSLMLSGMTGLTATVTAARGGDVNTRLAALSVSSFREGFAYDRGLDVRVTNTIDLGAADHDGVVAFHGGFGFQVAGGYRFHLTDTQGPFVRGGLETLIAGDALVYQSLLELPQVQLGYQYLAGSTLFEAAGRAGLSILGRSNTGYAATRHLDQVLDVGAMGTARTGPILLRGEWSHFLARDAGGPIDWLTLSLCGVARRIEVCTQTRAVEGDVAFPPHPVAASHVTQIGLTLGFASRY